MTADEPGQARFEDLLGIGDPAAFDPVAAWRARPAGDRLRVPLGVGDDGGPVTVDLRAEASGGAGPHGIVVGAGGSGKSELLRTLILALAVTHSPAELAFAFVDRYGGSAFAPLERLPHTAAVLTGLGEHPDRIERFVQTVTGELARRIEAPRAGPALLIVVDELTELLATRADLIDLFIQIGRVGRSTGVHLLLAGQRLEPGRLRGLDTHLSCRIALRTFTEEESRALIGAPEAARLPSRPGVGYVRTAGPDPVRFRAPVVSSLHRPAVAELLAARMRAAAPPVPPLALPPLTESPPLPALLGPLTTGRDTLALAVVDRPFERRYDTLTVQLDAGNIVIVGGPRSGKSTALQTLALGLALTHTPAEAQLYAFGQGALAGLPHTGGVAGRDDRERMARIAGELLTRLDRPPAGRVLLLVDDWGRLRSELDEFEPLLIDLARRGPAHGIRLVVTANRWAELRPVLRETFTTAVELRLGDPAESEIDRRAAKDVPYDRPGRGLAPGGHHLLVARPALTAGGDLAGAVAAIRAAWPHAPVPVVEPLPERVGPAALPAPERGRIPIGVERFALRPVVADLAAEPHLVVVGEPGCGKTAFLRGLAASVERAYRPEEARILLVDPRRTLAGAVAPAHLIAAVHDRPGIEEVLRQVLPPMRERLAGYTRGPELFVLVDDYDRLSGAAGPSPLLPLLDLLDRGRDIGLHLILARPDRGAARARYEPVLGRLRELGAPGLVMSGDRDEGPLIGDVRPERLPPGRGWFASRRDGRQLIQTPWHPPS